MDGSISKKQKWNADILICSHRKEATDMKTFGMKTVIHFGDNALDRLRADTIQKSTHHHRSLCSAEQND